MTGECAQLTRGGIQITRLGKMQDGLNLEECFLWDERANLRQSKPKKTYAKQIYKGEKNSP